MTGRANVKGLVRYFHLKTFEDDPVGGRKQEMVKDRGNWGRYQLIE